VRVTRGLVTVRDVTGDCRPPVEDITHKFDSENSDSSTSYRVLHMNLQFMLRKSLLVRLCLAPKMATVSQSRLGSVQATFSGPIVWLRTTVLLKRFELRRTFGEGACDRLTIIDRTFETFSPSILSLHGLYTSEYNLFDVNFYVYNL